MTEISVGRVTLRWTPHINHLRRVVLAQNGDEVIDIDNRVVVGEEKPPDVGEAEAEALGDYSGDSEPRRVTRRVGVPKPRYVLGNHDRRQGQIDVIFGELLFQPDVAAHVVWAPPKPHVLPALLPELGRPGNAENDVV